MESDKVIAHIDKKFEESNQMFKKHEAEEMTLFARHSLELEKIDRDILMMRQNQEELRKKDLEHDWHINRIWVVILISLGFIFSIILQLFLLQ